MSLARTTAMLALLASLGLLVLAGNAFGQSLTGGCSGSVNGSSPTSLTSSSPLVVGKGENITITGTAPSRSGPSVSADYSISIIEGIFQIDRRNESWSTNGARFRGTINVDDYLKFGSGLYKVEGTARPASGSWSCTASFYVELDGSKVIGLVGAGVAAAGGLGVMGAARAKPRFAEYSGGPAGAETESSAGMQGDSAESISKGFGKDFIGLSEDEMTTKKRPQMKDPLANGANTGWACLGAILGVLLIPWMMGAGLVPAVTNLSAGGSSKRSWVKGHPVLGFLSGLIAGLGATVALQQFGCWPLTTVSAIGFPLLAAVLGAWRGWRGTAYKRG